MHAATTVQGRRRPGKASQETYAATLPSTGFVRLPVVADVCCLAKSTIWAWTKAGRFPKPIKLSYRVTAWPVAEVRAWLANPTAWQAANGSEG